MSAKQPALSRRRTRLGWIILLAGCGLLLQWWLEPGDLTMTLGGVTLADRDLLLGLCLLGYAVMLVIPYLPAVEFGLMIMLIFGLPGIALTYITTLAGLFTAYLIGRNASAERRLGQCIDELLLPHWLRRLMQAFPSLSLVVLLNLPGNVIIGGGGGIAMSYGYLRQVSILQFLLAITLAVAPVPLLMSLGYRIF